LLAKGYDFVVVHAAGNSAVDAINNGVFSHITDPALRQRVITVGAVDSNYQMAYFTNYGSLVDVVAPGVDIYSSVASTDSSYSFYSGTSMAAPHVTGLAGLVWSANPGLTGPKVKQIIVDSAKESGRPILDTRSGAPRQTYYFANAKAAVDKAVGTPIVPVTGVSLNKSAISITVGGSETITATVVPSNASNKNVTWSSSNTGIATVSNGTVTGVAAGAATITATTQDGSKTATCAVTVTNTNVPVTGVTLNKTVTSINVGGSETLVATVAPSNATNKTVTWSSSNTAIATVNNGTVTGIAAGTATVTVTTQDGNKTATRRQRAR